MRAGSTVTWTHTVEPFFYVCLTNWQQPSLPIADDTQPPHDSNGVILLAHKAQVETQASCQNSHTDVNKTTILDLSNIAELLIPNHTIVLCRCKMLFLCSLASHHLRN